MTDDLYQQVILEEYKHPKNQGKLAVASATANVHNASCGDQLTLEVQTDGNGKIVDLAWLGQGCAISQASVSLVTEFVLGQQLTIQQAAHLTEAEILPLLGLTQIATGRQKCLNMIRVAFQQLATQQKAL